jgi:hypothetical protein
MLYCHVTVEHMKKERRRKIEATGHKQRKEEKRRRV